MVRNIHSTKKSPKHLKRRLLRGLYTELVTNEKTKHFGLYFVERLLFTCVLGV